MTALLQAAIASTETPSVAPHSMPTSGRPKSPRPRSTPGALEAPCAVSYGPVPGSVYAGHRFIDVVIHGWDIAIATGQPPTLAAHLVAACWDVINPQLADLQASGMFGSHTDPPASTNPQTRLQILSAEESGRRQVA